MATLAEIALQAGVSQATVSRVLNDKPGVSDSARQAVLTALDVLGYERPSKLKRRSAGLVGLIIPELNNPIFPLFAQTIEAVLVQRGFTPVLCTQSPGGVTEDEYIETLLDVGVAGIVFVSGTHADTRADRARYRNLLERGMPVVFINGHVPELPIPSVSDDDEEAVELAVSHLVDLGHRNIGLAVGREQMVPSQRKIAGFHKTMTRLLGMSYQSVEGWISQSLFSLEGGQAAARKLIAKGATGIVCGSDLMALGAIRGAAQEGLRVPEDVSVIGYDDSPLLALVAPPLTTIRQAVPQMSLAAVNALTDAIGGSPVPPHEYIFRPELVLRSSTAAPPKRHRRLSAIE